MLASNPLATPGPLIEAVYAYVAHRIGDGPDAEDVTSEVFERALRYRATYDPKRGSPIAWLVGIARRCINDRYRASKPATGPLGDVTAPGSVETETVDRVAVASAVETLDARSRRLLALRYEDELSIREIGALLALQPNAVEVALHRARTRIKRQLESAA